MAILVDTTTFAHEDAGSTTLTFSHTCSGATLLIVAVPESRSTAVNSVTYNGTAMSLAASKSNGNSWARIYYLTNPSSGANNVVVTYASSITYRQAGAASFSGTATSDVLGATSETSGSATQNKSLAITTTADNSLIIDCVGALSGVHTPTAGQTQFEGIGSGENRVGGYEIVGSAGSYTQTWNSTASADYSMVCAEFKEPASGPTKLKTWNGLSNTKIKTINGLAIAKVKTINSLT